MNKDLFVGEFSSECLTIKDWLGAKVKLNEYPVLYEYLYENGKQYAKVDIWNEFPSELPKPKYCGKCQCHKNSTLYIKQLQKSRNVHLSEMFFATGFVREECEVLIAHPDYMYGYIRHSFLVYKGKVLDITYLAFPPPYSEVTQYWGVAFNHALMRERWNIDYQIGISIDLVRFAMRKGGPFMIT